MKSLSYLNGVGSTSITVTDNRLATVIFNRMAPLSALDQLLTISSNNFTVNPGVEILEIINSATANIRYQVKIQTGGTPTLIGSSITWGTLPSGVTLATIGNTYTLSGISTLEHWNSIKTFTWNLPSNYSSYPSWFLEVSVIYYDEAQAKDVHKTWIVYDERYYYVAELTATSSLDFSGNTAKVKVTEAYLTSSSTEVVTGTKIKTISCNMSVISTVTAQGDILVARLTSNASISCTVGVVYRFIAPIISEASLSFKGTYNTGKFQANLVATCSINANHNFFNYEVVITSDNLVHQVTTRTEQARIGTSGGTLIGPTTFTIDWGDGTTNTYTHSGVGAGILRSHTYASPGTYRIYIKTPRILAVPSFATTYKPQVTQIFDWGVYSQKPSPYNRPAFLSNAFYNLVNLISVPNYIPTEFETLEATFAGASSFNSPNVSTWNTSNIGANGTRAAAMRYTFQRATSFNQPLSSWNTSGVTNMQAMFEYAISYNQNLSSWNVSNVIYHDLFDNGDTGWTEPHPFASVYNIANLSTTDPGTRYFNNPSTSLTVNGNLFQLQTPADNTSIQSGISITETLGLKTFSITQVGGHRVGDYVILGSWFESGSPTNCYKNLYGIITDINRQNLTMSVNVTNIVYKSGIFVPGDYWRIQFDPNYPQTILAPLVTLSDDNLHTNTIYKVQIIVPTYTSISGVQTLTGTLSIGIPTTSNTNDLLLTGTKSQINDQLSQIIFTPKSSNLISTTYRLSVYSTTDTLLFEFRDKPLLKFN